MVMLDNFLMVAYEAEKTASTRDELVEIMEGLPVEELHKIAQGKLAFGCDPGDWLDKYKGTPLFEQAMQLEQELLQAESAQLQKSLERNQEPNTYDQQEVLRLKKRMLDLQFAGQQVSTEPTATEMTPPAPAVKMAYATGGLVGGLVGAGRGGPGNRIEGVARGAVGEIGGALVGGGVGTAAGGLLGGGIGALAGNHETGSAIGRGLGGLAGGIYGGIKGSDAMTKDWGRLERLKSRGEKSKDEKTEKKASENFELALQKVAYGFDDELDEAISKGFTPDMTRQLARSNVNRTADSFKQTADKAKASPIKHRLTGGALGGGTGALVGGTLGLFAGRPGMGALAGGAIGGAAGFALASPERAIRTAHELDEQRKALLEESALAGALRDRALEIATADHGYDEDFGHYGPDRNTRRSAVNYLMAPQAEKKASALLDAAISKLAADEEARAKEAMGAAIMAGLRGAGSALSGAAGTAKGVFQAAGGGKAGLNALGTVVKPVGQALMNRGVAFAKDNPGAAAAIGAGALGTAATGGAVVS